MSFIIVHILFATYILGSDFFSRPRKDWHIYQIMTTLIFQSEVLYSELTNVVRFSSQICFFILENLRKLKRASVVVNWLKSVSRVKANELCSSKTQKKGSLYQFGKFVLKGLRNGLYLKRNYFI